MVATQNEAQDKHATYAAGVNAILHIPVTAEDLGQVLTEMGNLRST
jgi:hypothetical protein